LYSVDETIPLIRLKEKRASACVQAGAIFVNQSAEEFFRQSFTKAKLDKETIAEYTEEAIESFEIEAKRTFKSETEDKLVNVGGRKFTNTQLNVRRGTMTLKGTKMQEFFDPWVNKILDSVNDQVSGHSVKYILLVGGFGESQYLRQKLAAGPGSTGIKITIADDPASKAVADGAVIWFARHVVTARAARFAFGTDMLVPSEPMHGPKLGRKIVQSPSGPHLEGGWSEIVTKGRVMETQEEVVRSFHRTYKSSSPSHLGSFSSSIYAYDGNEDKPMFMEDAHGNMITGFRRVCRVEANLSALGGSLTRKSGPNGEYWQINYSIGLKFGGTELQAALIWKEKGETRRGPATIVPLHTLTRF